MDLLNVYKNLNFMENVDNCPEASGSTCRDETKKFYSSPLLKTINLDSKIVETYELITDEHRKSAKSGVARGIVGGALLGPVGMLAGGISAKTKGIYQIAIQFKDGKRSLLEVDDKIYKSIIKDCF